MSEPSLAPEGHGLWISTALLFSIVFCTVADNAADDRVYIDMMMNGYKGCPLQNGSDPFFFVSDIASCF